MSLWDTVKKEGSLLGDISGVTAVAHAVEHPLNWKNDAMAAMVLGSYAFGGPLSRGALGLGERLLGKRMLEAAPAEVGSALHAAWGTPKGVPVTSLVAKLTGRRAAGNAALVDIANRGGIEATAIKPSAPNFISRYLDAGVQPRTFAGTLKDLAQRQNPSWTGFKEAAFHGPDSALGSADLARALKQKLTGGAMQAGEGETRGMFFSPLRGMKGERVPYSRDNQHVLADRLTQATNPMTHSGTPISVSEPYSLANAGNAGRVRVGDSSYPSLAHPNYGHTTQRLVSDSHPLYEKYAPSTPNSEAINVHNIIKLLQQMGYTRQGLSG